VPDLSCITTFPSGKWAQSQGCKQWYNRMAYCHVAQHVRRVSRQWYFYHQSGWGFL
jgi:hypothetical protein